jgi:hypothetical protein
MWVSGKKVVNATATTVLAMRPVVAQVVLTYSAANHRFRSGYRDLLKDEEVCK